MPVLIDDLITNLEVEREQLEHDRTRAVERARGIIAAVSAEGRSNLTADEEAEVQRLTAKRDKCTSDLAGNAQRLNMAKESKRAEAEIAEGQRQISDAPAGRPAPVAVGRSDRPAYDRVMRVGQEERTYRPDYDKKGVRFLKDVVASWRGDPQASMRLQRHMTEERLEYGEQYFERAAGDSTTANWAGLTVPQYLTDMYAPATAALRPFADICNHHDLPPNGMTVNISQVTTASGVALQSAELGAVQATSIDDTLLTENVQTAAGQVTLSRQAIDRGTGIEEVTMQDLFRRYATTLDNTLITQSVTGLQALAQLITFTSGSPTAALAYPKIVGAAAGVEAALLAQATPSHAIMHSRRWYWLASQLGSTWPLINALGSAFPYAGGVANADSSYSKGVRGNLPIGLDVVVDNNVATNLGIGTNQDQIYVVSADECHLWEDPDAPVFIRAEQPKAANLGVLLVLYGYFAYTFRRYANAVQAVDGTGLTTPSF